MARPAKRLTHKKKFTPPPAPDGVPSHEEWKDMPLIFGNFVIQDSDSELQFKCGHTAFIAHIDMDLEHKASKDQFWIGVIRDVRARSPEDVWVRVQWYWDGKDVGGIIKSFDPLACGKYERILSDSFDYVSTQTFHGFAEVKFLDERSVVQAQIGNNEFFTRCDLRYNAKRVLRRANLCVCGIPFNPDTDPIVHFCPRPSCLAGYHQYCLLKRGCWDLNLSDRNMRLIEAIPDNNKQVSYKDKVAPQQPRKKRKMRYSDYQIAEPLAILSRFPAELITAAQQQIVKGTEAGGLVGNVAAVCAARSLIYNSFEGGLPDDWEDQVDLEMAFPNIDGLLPTLVCPACEGPI